MTRRNVQSDLNLSTTTDTEEPLGKQGKGERKIRTYFLRLFGRYDLRDKEQFIRFGKWLIFIILIMMELFVLLQHFANFVASGGWVRFFLLLALESTLTISQAMKLFVVKNNKVRIPFYVLDAIAACCFIFFSDGTYALILYMLVLTGFYLGAEINKRAFSVFFLGVFFYACGYVLQTYFHARQNGVSSLDLYFVITRSFSSLFALAVHFLGVQIALAFYRQFLRLDNALKQLDKSKKELEKAYSVVAEVTALEERQRIARDIHDTAGHSITTVIMQTEAAKLILADNPNEARQKIVAANLQAKHALEELRDSVHLLSGIEGQKTLKMALEEVIHESTDGTGITIRSEIDEVSVSSAKFRFLSNALKEGISNALRHGGATAFWFELKSSEKKIRFLLSDNGCGVDGEPLLGFGLTGLKERAVAFGGTVAFSSGKDQGFEIEIVLPVDEE